jgi:hypothetical protein
VGFRTAAVNYDSRLKITKGGNTTIGNAQKKKEREKERKKERKKE